MIGLKKSFDEYVYEFVHSVLTNNPLPDDEKVRGSSTTGEDNSQPINEASQSTLLKSIALQIKQQLSGTVGTNLRGQPISKMGNLVTKEKLKMYISPRFPNNVFLPDQLKNFSENQYFQIFFVLWADEQENQTGAIVDRLVRRRFIFVFPTSQITETTEADIFVYLESALQAETYESDKYGYPYLTTIPIPRIDTPIIIIPPTPIGK